MGRPTLRIEIKKTHDGRPSLACVRADASRTWARVHPFLPTHDLAHYAVESVLGIDDAFFGLIAQGWAIDDFASPGVVRRLPAAAMYVERIVGYVERGMAPDAAALASALALDGTAAAEPTGAAGAAFPASPRNSSRPSLRSARRASPSGGRFHPVRRCGSPSPRPRPELARGAGRARGYRFAPVRWVSNQAIHRAHWSRSLA